MSVKVLFVCLGNICRSPTAQGVFEQLVTDHQLSNIITTDSAGTAAWHIGKQPDSRSIAAAARRGCDLTGLRARQVSRSDFDQFDYILAMDSSNLADLQALCPADYRGELALFLDYGDSDIEAVPDPYYGDGDGFEQVLDLVEQASAGLLASIQQQTHNPVS
ncbi:phosphotyrosine protein phosphatase [Oceanicoccus sagamiensis]|uniref:protein-tyrosine-phosphatase n=2 Tax=Oceanicoccus sagamiensis TaxID=716816 RepID=A0A1X9NG66_9GAMM|nr:phosphotyrosine protein phosphatase [Oceanicoccus sagamiensis]